MKADAVTAKTGEERTSLYGRGNEDETVEVVLEAAGRMCGVGSRRGAKLTARLPQFEARR